MSDWEIAESPPPPPLRRARREANLLWYAPSRLLAAETSSGTVGAIRFALRDDLRRREGLITDLVVEPSYRERGLPEALIERAEQELRKDGVEKVDSVVLDGQRLTEPFHAAGYWPFRKTVVLVWDLSRLRELPEQRDFSVEFSDSIDVEEVADFIFRSYQPYWRWWKEVGGERPIDRVDYLVEQPAVDRERARAENLDRVLALLATFGEREPQRMAIARRHGKIVGLCDAKLRRDDDTFDWGVLIAREAGGRAIGSALLKPALEWLRAEGLPTAQVTAPSGLDDYDPTVYLYVLAAGASIQGEFLDLVKRRF